MRLSLFSLSLFPALALATISVTGPSSDLYWVQNASNTISWTFAQGDPNPVDIIVTNAANTTLNGAFSIAQFVNVSDQTFTVTNVTLRPGSNYQVVFVSAGNQSQILANSTNFDVKPPGTAPANNTATSSASSSASGTGSSSSAPHSTSPAPVPESGASRLMLSDTRGLFFALGACSFASLAGILL
ncbi:hypothetical protein EVG20_g7511 [Dentipellis fragilis]|uniref:Yeast cell wall synthesis Kre9/Knh1-like N-terminal domain-containing protein n=1 Tax=Dentipellis fragilis TaxID=205917 RepID=A0A4Y9YDU8_9AGAM|nr:hypothetical protein EVG20_g7511 [Dentipellis fragilis]